MKSKAMFVCNECKSSFAKWLGRCPDCNAWGTLEETLKSSEAKVCKLAAGPAQLSRIDELEIDDSQRYDTGFEEINRILGGGLVEGGLTLICGEPGIGKSTLLLQICNQIKVSRPIYYFSGEESARQIKLRADRLKIKNPNIFLASCAELDAIESRLRCDLPSLAIVDSIQTLQITSSDFGSSVSQVKESAMRLMHLAKSLGVAILVVGHVNKEGAIAGPKALEHIVDTVLYFEGERSSNYRLLRAVKNRFGPTCELTVLDMQEDGLKEVKDASSTLLDDDAQSAPGTCVTCFMEGTRPLFLEIQALVAKSGFAAPRRTATGLDYNRICVLIAVLEKRLGFKFSTLDAYVNVVGGFRLNEPASDLAVVLALISTLKDQPLGKRTVAFGEIDLTGRVRSISNVKARVQESARLGFERCILPKAALRSLGSDKWDVELLAVSSVKELAKLF